jgi:hypothetical protein
MIARQLQNGLEKLSKRFSVLRSIFLFSSSLWLISYAFAEQKCSPEKIPERVSWKNSARSWVLHCFDGLLNWSLPESDRTFSLENPLSPPYRDQVPAIHQFVKLHGYFSPYFPLVGKVTLNPEDMNVVCYLFQTIALEVDDLFLKEITTAEVLAKVLAYRNLKIGDQISFPSLDGEGKMVEYQVDDVLNLWLGMPAFGLIPQGEGEPILLFRGTDFSLYTKRSWASLMSDVDMAGPGFYAFQHAQSEIHHWLEKTAQQHGKARILGYSLGGVLAAYAYIFENELISDRDSFAFNLPGVSDQVIEKWNELPEERKHSLISFVNQGDPVSKIGKLFGEVYEWSLDAPMKPLTAHTKLITAEPLFYQRRVDIPAENASRLKQVH